MDLAEILIQTSYTCVLKWLPSKWDLWICFRITGKGGIGKETDKTS